MIGKAFSHHKIPQKIGAGGMGEVDLAGDLNIHRPAASKLPPGVFAGDPDRPARKSQ